MKIVKGDILFVSITENYQDWEQISNSRMNIESSWHQIPRAISSRNIEAKKKSNCLVVYSISIEGEAEKTKNKFPIG